MLWCFNIQQIPIYITKNKFKMVIPIPKKEIKQPIKPKEETKNKVIKALKSNKLISRYKLTRYGVDWNSLKVILNELIKKGYVQEIKSKNRKLYRWTKKKGFFDF